MASVRRELHGIGVSAGIRLGPSRRLQAPPPRPPTGQGHQGDPAAERRRATLALEQTAADLDSRAGQAAGAAAEVLAAQALMARDPALAEEVGQRIDAGASAARAVDDAFGMFRQQLAAAGGYMAARAEDLDDIRNRVLACLQGEPMPGLPERGPGEPPFVLVARNLAPADTSLLDPASVAGFVTEDGGPTSHTAILARELGVPAVVACPGAAGLTDETPLLLDGESGVVVANPAAAELPQAPAAAAASTAHAPSGPGKTADGHGVALLANIGGPHDLDAATAAGADGVGLYRTEFLFAGRTDAPGTAEQRDAYACALQAFPTGVVIVRVLDAGADKPLRFLPPPGSEGNPALGERGLRMLRRYPAVLDGQLEALADAADATSAADRLGVMAPMVADGEDARWFAERCHERGIRRGGIMIEIPSAALRARELARHAAFFSVGTNDLAQYTYAADREAAPLARFADPWQPALLDLIAAAADAATAAGKPCGVCGEAAADPALASVLVGLGVTSLSMSPRVLPRVRAALARCSRAACEAAATAARSASTAQAARHAAQAELA